MYTYPEWRPPEMYLLLVKKSNEALETELLDSLKKVGISPRVGNTNGIPELRVPNGEGTSWVKGKCRIFEFTEKLRVQTGAN